MSRSAPTAFSLNLLFLIGVIADRDYAVSAGIAANAAISVVHIAFGVWFWLRPESRRFFVALCVWQLALYAGGLPDAGNHSMFAAAAALAGIALAAQTWASTVAKGRTRGEPKPSAEGEAVRFTSLALPTLFFWFYFWAVFHKLNAGFFDPALTCAHAIPNFILQRYLGIRLPEDATLSTMLIGATFFFEGFVPHLVIWRRVRSWALIALLAFHWTLAIHYFEFLPLVALLILPFMGEAERGRFVAAIRRVLHAASGRGLVVFLGAMLLTQAFRWTPWAPKDVRVALSWLMFIAAGALFLPMILALAGSPQKPFVNPGPRKRWALPVLLSIFINANALGPYIGYRSVSSMAMYSNLRLEDLNHHFVLNDAVRAVPRSDQWLRFRAPGGMNGSPLNRHSMHRILADKETLKLDSFELGRALSEADPKRYREIVGLSADNESLQRLIALQSDYERAPLYRRLFFAHRPLSEDATAYCQW